jgi:hypothetical protein
MPFRDPVGNAGGVYVPLRNATLDIIVVMITLLDAFVFYTASVLTHQSGCQTLTKVRRNDDTFSVLLVALEQFVGHYHTLAAHLVRHHCLCHVLPVSQISNDRRAGELS